MVVVIGVVLPLLGSCGNPPDSTLIAINRVTGSERWTLDLGRSGAQWVWLEGEQLVVAACRNERIELLLDPAAGAVVGERDQFALGSGGATVDGAGVVWKELDEYGYGMATTTELQYDRETRSLVSTEGWSREFEASGPVWIPVLLLDDTVYAIERAGECTGFD